MAKWWHVRTKFAFALLSIFCGLGLLGFASGLVYLQLRPWNLARDTGRENPQTNQIPIALADQSSAPLSGTRVSGHGFSIGTPWQTIESQDDQKSFSTLFFKDGPTLEIKNETEWTRFASLFRKDPRFVRLLGEDTLRSEFALMRAEMYATPDQVKWWKFPPQNLRAMNLVNWKSVHCNEYGTIHAVSFGRIHGFQEGEPNVAPYKIALNLFDPDDRHYEISITGEEGKPLPLTQAQLNSMIASIQPDPTK